MGSDTKGGSPDRERGVVSLASRIRSADKARLLAIEHAQERMRASFPRLQMSLIVALTGGSGLLASVLLLHGGRYYERYQRGANVVLWEPDMAKVFHEFGDGE